MKHYNPKALLDSIVEGIREKKGKQIAILDMSNIDDAVCSYMVITQGNTPIQVDAIYDSVVDTVRIRTSDKPLYTHTGNGEWVALDYVDVIVHIFVPELREFYKIEQLWDDAILERLDDE